MSLLPPVPLATLAFSIGLLGGVAGLGSVPLPEAGSPARSGPSAQAAIVPPIGPEASAGPAGHTVRRSADGLFYIWARVNGRPVRFLVDTGASVVVLRASDAAATGVRAGAFTGRMDTAGGAASMAWTRLDTVSIGDRQVNGLRAAVVRDGLGVSLLGANMLSRLGSVSISGDRLELR